VREPKLFLVPQFLHESDFYLLLIKIALKVQQMGFDFVTSGWIIEV